MSRRNRFADGWAALSGVVLGGLAFAAIPGEPVAAIVGVGVAAVAYGAKVGGSALVDRNKPDSMAPLEGPLPKRGSPAEVWLGRAQNATRKRDALIASASDSYLKDQLDSVAIQTSGTLETIGRLSRQVAALEQGLDRIPLARLTEQQSRLQAEANRGLTDESSIETSNSLRSVNEQLQSFQRLHAARDGLVARMESATVGLESLNSHIAELIAMSATSVTVQNLSGEGTIEALNQELSDIRAGLEESETYTREVLGRDLT
ncbi:hypothetical protein CLV47_102304 [Antricoccus suffuscus]|uniref:Uncharacterized protein n=1 Tax=Antricoccus suffuscus TaxID=1629062 RepID=A0A2T1A4T6_9ACTN|nr:hypothetical protein [Antricoccus suffuscus]PRZ43613.1 hypothetical protein CLV47_102304 [Antricoccus suffuscus]